MNTIDCITVRFLVLTILLTIVMACGASATSWTSFIPAQFDDIFVDKPFATGSSTTYTLTLGSNPKVMLDGVWYDVTEVWGFYAVAGTDGSGTHYDFTEDRAPKDGWEFDPKSEGSSDFAGWKDPDKGSVITPGGSDTFTFVSMDLKGYDAVLGLHITLAQPYKGGNTLHVKSDPVPEPSGIAGLGMALSTLSAAVWKRRK